MTAEGHEDPFLPRPAGGGEHSEPEGALLLSSPLHHASHGPLPPLRGGGTGVALVLAGC